MLRTPCPVLDDRDRHFAIDDVGHGLASVGEAPEEDLVHEETLDLVFHEPRDVARPEGELAE